MSSRSLNWPLTRISTRSLLVSTEPLACSALWLRTASAICSGVMPSAARRSWENSTNTFLACLPIQVDLLDHRHLQQAPLDVLGDVRELGVRDAVGLDRVEQRGDVAILVVEDRADHAVGQLQLDVAELLARLVPGFALVFVRGAALDGDGHAAIALARVGLDLLEVIELLELLLHAVEHLVLDLLGRSARPHDEGRHRRHGEVRVLELAQLGEAVPAADGDRQDDEQHHGAVAERPFGQVEGLHRDACLLATLPTAVGSATFNPGAIFCTPAVTTSSPAGGPDTSTTSLR